MKVISKNCAKPASKEKQRKSMAEFGTTAYLTPRPNSPLEAVHTSTKRKDEKCVRY